MRKTVLGFLFSPCALQFCAALSTLPTNLTKNTALFNPGTVQPCPIHKSLPISPSPLLLTSQQCRARSLHPAQHHIWPHLPNFRFVWNPNLIAASPLQHNICSTLPTHTHGPKSRLSEECRSGLWSPQPSVLCLVLAIAIAKQVFIYLLIGTSKEMLLLYTYRQVACVITCSLHDTLFPKQH